MKFFYYILLLSLAWQAPAWANLDETTDDGQARNKTLITKALSQLGIPQKNCYCGLAITKQLPFGNKDTVVVIPEIASMEEDSSVFSLDSHILLVDSNTGNIKSRYYESSDSNGWESDAVVLSDIKIDTARYQLTPKKRGFGVRVSYNGSSKSDPFNYETLSLYLAKGSSIKQLLKNLPVHQLNGMTNLRCNGDWLTRTRQLIMSPSMTNGYRDITIKTISKKERRRTSPAHSNHTDDDTETCVTLPSKMATNSVTMRYRPFDSRQSDDRTSGYVLDNLPNEFVTYQGTLSQESDNPHDNSQDNHQKKTIPIQLSLWVINPTRTPQRNNPDGNNTDLTVVGSLRYLNQKHSKAITIIGTQNIEVNFPYLYLQEFSPKGHITGRLILDSFGTGWVGDWDTVPYNNQATYDVRLKRINAVTPKTWSAPKADWFGEYYYQYGDKGSQGGFSLKKLTNNTARFVLTSVTSAPARNIADIDSTVTLGKTGFTVKPFKNKPKCKIKVDFYKGFANVTYTHSEAYNACEFGLNATAEGVFLKVK